MSCIDITAPTAERMLDDADFALYQVKHEGRDGVAVRSQDSSLASQSPSSESA